ncbi:LysR family transcriptional regulator [Streptomyces sp. SAJ15]|uniref:LysR substrate-binding domain-containing protein n=1 Tax=Streptomyces sp. SAJ15 TaxID=2011095 RepID=UPI001642FEB8|nr:LysR family transcriptional regulator [Streptomyces sp. SAJ15]
MELRLLRYAVTVADEGSVSAAARRLHMTQPTLSRQLRELERQLGTVLFARDGRTLVPTAAGTALVDRARRVLAEAGRLREDVDAAAQGRTGRLTVTFSGSGINGPLGAALGRLHTDLPDLDLRLVESFDDQAMSQGVLDGRYDLAVQRLPLASGELTATAWWSEPLSVFLPATHPLAQGLARQPADLTVLDEIPLVLWPRDVSPRSYDEIIALCHRAGVSPRIAAEGRTVQTLLALVAAGFGAAILTDSHRTLRRAGVTPRLLNHTTTTLYLTHRTDNTNPSLDRLLDALTLKPH